MSIDQLANRLDDRFRLLTGGSRTALPRHRTLRAVVDWSWELLTDAERMVLRRLSVFSGGASLEAAERVCVGDAVEPEQVLELLTSLAEKSLLVTDGDGAPRYRMLGTIKEYAADRLAEAGESDLARQAHLAYFTELAETAEPHLRRAEQLEWLATLEAEHDNISAAMRGAIAAGEAQAAMRLAAAAGWYWWLGGRRAEGLELMIAATDTPGEVTDEVRAMVYALVVLFVTSGRGDEHQAAEWIHKAYRFSQRSQARQPAAGIGDPAGTHAAGAGRSPCPRSSRCWTTTTPGYARWPGCSSARCGSCSARAAGRRRRIWSWRSPSSGRSANGSGSRSPCPSWRSSIAMRGEFAGACEHYEQAIAVVTEVGAIEDVIRMRTRQALLYWLRRRSGRQRGRHRRGRAERRAGHLAVRAGRAGAGQGGARSLGRRRRARPAVNSASRPRSWATTRSRRTSARRSTTCSATWPTISHEARAHRVAAWQAASEAGHAPLIAQMLVGFADLALRLDQYEQAARLLAASVGVRGLPDRSHPDAARIERDARRHLGEARFAEATREGTQTSWSRAGRGHARFVRSGRRALDDDVAVPRAGVDRDLGSRRCQVLLRRNGVAHRPSLAVDVDGGSGALADADLDVARAVHQLRLTAVIRPIRMAPLAVVAVTLPSARSMSKLPLALLRSRSAEAWPIRTCPRAPSMSARPGDVADRDVTGRDVRLQRVDAIQLDPTRCHVQLALAE